VSGSAVGVLLVSAIALAGQGCGDGGERPASEAPSAEGTTTTSQAAHDEGWEDYEVDLATATLLSRREFRKLPRADPDDVEGFARHLLAVGRLHDNFADEVEEFDPPPDAARAHEDMVAAVRKQGEAYHAAGKASLDGSAQAVEVRQLLNEAMASDRASAHARRALTGELR